MNRTWFKTRSQSLGPEICKISYLHLEGWSELVDTIDSGHSGGWWPGEDGGGLGDSSNTDWLSLDTEDWFRLLSCHHWSRDHSLGGVSINNSVAAHVTGAAPAMLNMNKMNKNE